MKPPKTPAAPTPPPMPTKDQAAASSDSLSSKIKRRGYQSTILGGAKPAGAESNPLKSLLGQ